LEYLEAAMDEKLNSMPPIRWKDRHSVCIVMASRGYPGKYQTGKVIHGLNSKFDVDTYIFHAGTKKNSMGEIITNGGRVLSVTSLADTLEGAKNKSYSAVSKIHWGDNEEYFRRDIASKGIKYMKSALSE
jgi:phosphoribosylamine--glycine ligase